MMTYLGSLTTQAADAAPGNIAAECAAGESRGSMRTSVDATATCAVRRESAPASPEPANDRVSQTGVPTVSTVTTVGPLKSST